MEDSAGISPADGNSDVGVDDLNDSIASDDGPARKAGQKRHWLRNSRVAALRNGVGLELGFLHYGGAVNRRGFTLPLRCTKGSRIGHKRDGHRARVDHRLPPHHAVFRTFRPTTRPSRTGMIVATRRGSRAARSLNARTPSAGPERSLGSTAAPWKKALSQSSNPPRRSSRMPQSKYWGSGPLSASMNTASHPRPPAARPPRAPPPTPRTPR